MYAHFKNIYRINTATSVVGKKVKIRIEKRTRRRVNRRRQKAAVENVIANATLTKRVLHEVITVIAIAIPKANVLVAAAKTMKRRQVVRTNTVGRHLEAESGHIHRKVIGPVVVGALRRLVAKTVIAMKIRNL